MAIALAVLGVANILYGVTVMTLNSGTAFFAVWYALGTALLAAAWATHADLWSLLPPLARNVGLAALGAALLALACALAPIVSQLGATGEADLDYVIVLGAQIYDDGSPSPVLKHRLDAALAYLEQNPSTTCIVSGGKGPNEPYPEADGMASYLGRHGIAQDRIIRERTSVNTKQNIVNSMALMRSGHARVGIVTNNFHVYRAVRIARKAGLSDACGIAGYSTPWYLPNNLLRECLGLVKDQMVGNI